MMYGSVCSGVEAASLAWEPLGFKAAWFSEIDPFCGALLAYRYPEVINHGDFTGIGQDAGPIDILVGGTPCQSFSVSGLRGGMDDARGNLTLEFARLAGRLRPRWLVWENVPGVLSIDGGRAFGSLLGALAELGYGFAYRILDAQYFGVPQRRRRVFVVGHLGDWRRAAAVLFERHSLSGDPPPRFSARPQSAGTLGGGPGGRCPGTDHMTFVPEVAKKWNTNLVAPRADHMTFVPEVSKSLMANPGCTHWNQTWVAPRADHMTGPAYHAPPPDGHPRSLPHFDRGVDANGDAGSDRLVVVHGTQDPITSDMAFPTQRNNGGENVVCINLRGREGGAMPEVSALASVRSASGGSSRSYLSGRAMLRRLTPRECERLQGMPDDWTLIPFRGRRAADSSRYAAIGNSMAVDVMRWIGGRIKAVDAIQTQGTRRKEREKANGNSNEYCGWSYRGRGNAVVPVVLNTRNNEDDFVHRAAAADSDPAGWPISLPG